MTATRGSLAGCPPGWAWPLNARKAHYFPAGDAVSLCGRWLFLGRRDPAPVSTANDCVACTRMLGKVKP